MGYKTYQTFDDFFADQPATEQKIIAALRQFVKKVAPELTEGSKWGGGVWLNNELPVVFTNTHTEVVQLGFFAGSMLNDPSEVLEGKGKFIRHIKLHSTDDVNEQVLTPLIQQAATLDYKKKVSK